MLKRNPDYVFREIAGISYLLPYGQCVADHHQGVKINDSGVVLWSLLEKGMDRQTLFERFCSYYEAQGQQRMEMQKDMENFLTLLLAHGILIEEEEVAVLAGAVSRYYKIGVLCMKITAPPEAFPKQLEPYETKERKENLTLELKLDVLRMQESGKLLIRNEEIMVFEKEKEYLVQFLQTSQIVEAYFSKDGKRGEYYYTPPCSEAFAEELFHAFRFFYLYAAQLHGCHALHSASILYRDKAWLFSGYSGAGKSTHTNLWKKLFHTRILNGDLNLMGFDNGIPVVYGIPWCGTSGISQTECYPLGGIILLKQAKKEACLELPEDKKVLLVSQRMISPVWTEQMLEKNIAFTEELAKQVLIFRLECTKEDSAAEITKDWIDSYLEMEK